MILLLFQQQGLKKIIFSLKMNTLGQIPLLRVTVPLILGITAWLVYGRIFPQELFWVVYLLTFVIWSLIRGWLVSSFSYRWIIGLLLTLLFFIAGYHRAQHFHQLGKTDHFSNVSGEEGYLLVRLIQPAAEKQNSFQLNVRVEGFFCNKGNPIKPALGKMLIYLQKDSLSGILRYGDILLIENQYQSLAGPLNPGQFDYRRFMASHNIFHQSYLRGDQWIHTGENRGSWLKKQALGLQGKALDIFNARLPSREYALAAALFLGKRDHLDDELQRRFAGAGAMHVLCVSGLHVGILFLILQFCLAFTKRFPFGRFLQTLLIIFLIWTFAAMTGLAPPVMRASLMFSIIAFGNCLRRQTNIYNTLAGSALVLIIVDPFVITRIGFQLSYMAIIGIVSWQPWISRQLFFNNQLMQKAWDIAAVSMAAQLATLPLVLFYFHQFPNYFLLTNIGVIPLAGGVILSSLATLMLAGLPVLNVVAGKILQFLLFLMHQLVVFVEALPHAVSSGWYVHAGQVLLFYGMLLGFTLWLVHQRRQFLLPALGLALVLATTFAIRNIQIQQSRKMVVYHTSHALGVDLIMGRQLIMLCDSALLAGQRTVDLHISGNRVMCGIKEMNDTLVLQQQHAYHQPWLSRKGPFICFEKTLICIPDKSFSLPEELQADMPVDYLIINRNPGTDLRVLIRHLQPRMVVFAATASRYYLENWQQLCDSLQQPFWDVGTQGAFVAEL